MSVEQSTVIDFVSIDPMGRLILTISDHLEWDDENRHLFLLQEKLNAYMRFIESGEAYEKFPEARDQPIIINMTCLYEMDSISRQTVEKFRQAIKEAGVDLTWSRVGPMQ